MKINACFILLLTASLAACGNNNSGGGTGNPNSATSGGNTSGGNTNGGSNPQMRFLGRVIPDSNGNALLSWPGAAVQVSTSATELSANLQLVPSVSNADAGAVQFFIDGVAQGGRTQLSPGTTNYSIPGLDGKQHVVTLVKITEAADGDVQFSGFNGTLDANGPAAPARRIEFIGDSITVGFDIEGPVGNPNTCPGDVYPFASDPNLSNTSKDYAFLTAQDFNADYSMIAYSGRGVYRNNDLTFTATEATLPSLWTMTDNNNPNVLWTFPAASAPTLVVINLGTNDFSDNDQGSVQGSLPDETGFVTAYADFLQAINGKYPNVPILVTIGPMLSNSTTVAGEPQLSTAESYINQAITASGLSNVQFFAYTPSDGEWTCDYHPDPAEAQLMATQLEAFISANVSGWN